MTGYAKPGVTPDARRHAGYVFGRTEGSGEVGTSAVCAHGQPLGWACSGCATDRGKRGGTVPAGPHADTFYRAVCDHCGSRVWVPSAEVPEEVRLIVDREEAIARAESTARWDEHFRGDR